MLWSHPLERNVGAQPDINVRSRTQLLLAGANAAGFEVAVHGTVDLMFNPMFGGALLLLGAVIVYFTDRGALARNERAGGGKRDATRTPRTRNRG